MKELESRPQRTRRLSQFLIWTSCDTTIENHLTLYTLWSPESFQIPFALVQLTPNQHLDRLTEDCYKEYELKSSDRPTSSLPIRRPNQPIFQVHLPLLVRRKVVFFFDEQMAEPVPQMTSSASRELEEYEGEGGRPPFLLNIARPSC